MAKSLSVIIPAFDRREDLCRCIDSILEQTFEAIEIIVIDDCSEDDTIEHLRSHYPDVHLIQCERRYGPSHLRNLGLIEAGGEFVLFLDSDVVLPNKYVITRMVEELSNNSGMGEFGGEIPVYLGIKDEARGKRRDYFGKNHDVISRRSITVSGDLKECTYLATCNCMVRKKLAFEVGGFDPYYKFGGEDADFGYVIKKRGYVNMVDFKVGVHHRRSTTGRYPDETYRYHLTRVRFNLKHLSIMRNLSIFLMDFFGFILFYLLLLPKLAIKRVKNETLVTENYLGGYYLIKAYKVNLLKYAELKRLRGVDFLSKKEMNRFESSVGHPS